MRGRWQGFLGSWEGGAWKSTQQEWPQHLWLGMAEIQKHGYLGTSHPSHRSTCTLLVSVNSHFHAPPLRLSPWTHQYPESFLPSSLLISYSSPSFMSTTKMPFSSSYRAPSHPISLSQSAAHRCIPWPLPSFSHQSSYYFYHRHSSPFSSQSPLHSPFSHKYPFSLTDRASWNTLAN